MTSSPVSTTTSRPFLSLLISRRHSTASSLKPLSTCRLEQSFCSDRVYTWLLLFLLEQSFVVTGSTLDWISSYMEARSTLCVGNKTRPMCFLWMLAYLKDHLLDHVSCRCMSRYVCRPSLTRSVSVINSTLTTLKSTSPCRDLTYLTTLICCKTA